MTTFVPDGRVPIFSAELGLRPFSPWVKIAGASWLFGARLTLGADGFEVKALSPRWAPYAAIRQAELYQYPLSPPFIEIVLRKRILTFIITVPSRETAARVCERLAWEGVPLGPAARRLEERGA